MFFQHKQNNAKAPLQPAINNLPQPPQNWREMSSRSTEPQQQQQPKPPQAQKTFVFNQRNSYPSQQKQHQQPQNPNQNYHQPPNNNVRPSFMHHPQPFFRNDSSSYGRPQQRMGFQNSPNQMNSRPNGPQNLSNNIRHSAFIPLQATQQIFNPRIIQQNLPPMRSQQQQPPPQFVQRNAEQRQIVGQKQEETRQNFAAFMNSGSNVVANKSTEQKRTAAPKPRPSRIAANFGGTPES